MANLFSTQRFLAVYSGVLTIAFASVVLLGARKPPSNATFDQITVNRINVVEPDGTTRMVLSDHAEFPGSYYMGKEFPRTDRSETGILFNDNEGTEVGGLIFGGMRDKDGTPHSWGHLSFDQYQRDQTIVLESDNDGPSSNVFYKVNDDDTPWALTPAVSAELQQAKAMPPGAGRTAAIKAWRVKYPGGSINRGYFGIQQDKSVSLTLRDRQGRERLIADVGPDGAPRIEFLDADGKVTRSITADSN